MNRFLLPLLVATLPLLSVSAQDYSICTQVIGSAGQTVQIQGQKWSYTVGEAVITTIQDPILGRTLTQGFHQPELCTTVSTAAPDLDEWDILIFPNPTSDLVFIHFQTFENRNLLLQASNALGQLLLQEQLISNSGSFVLDASTWQSGVYFLRFIDPTTKAQGSFRLIRL